MRFHFLVAAAFALTIPVYGRAVGTDLLSRDITESDDLSTALINSRGTEKGVTTQGKTTKITTAILGTNIPG
jgi:hypothetical protein